MDYDFTVTRIGIGHISFSIEADSYAEALDGAQEIAMDTAFSEHESDYVFDCPQSDEKGDALSRIKELYEGTGSFSIHDIEAAGIVVEASKTTDLMVLGTHFDGSCLEADVSMGDRIHDTVTIRYGDLETDTLYEVLGYFEEYSALLEKTDKRSRG